MEIIDKYTKEINEDCKIDVLNLRDVQMMLPAVKHKWTARLINHKIEKDKIRRMITDAKNTLIERQLADTKVKMSRPTLEKMVEENSTVLKLKEKETEQEYAIMYLEKVEQIMKGITFDIKNLTEIMKLEQL